MEQITLRIREDELEALDAEADELGISRSEHIRDILESRGETEWLRDRLEQRVARVNDLEEQLAKRSEVEEKVDVLARRVEDREAAADAPFPVRWLRWWRRYRESESESP